MIIEVPPMEIPAGPSAIPYRYVSVPTGLTEDKWFAWIRVLAFRAYCDASHAKLSRTTW